MAGQSGLGKAWIFSVDIRERIDKLARPLGHAGLQARRFPDR
jgi:hypothetical protein